jgi:hypothetical protein
MYRRHLEPQTGNTRKEPLHITLLKCYDYRTKNTESCKRKTTNPSESYLTSQKKLLRDRKA